MNAWAAKHGRPLGIYRLYMYIRCLLGLAAVVPSFILLSLAVVWENERQCWTDKPQALASLVLGNLDPGKGLFEEIWSVLAPNRALVSAQNQADDKWRLAGTFFSFPEQGQSLCKAVLDNLAENTQVAVGEGEMLDGMRVVRIFTDHVVVEREGRQDVLWLSFSGKRSGSDLDVKSTSTGTTAAEGGVDKSKFGTRVGERRWIMNRDALMAYCNELRENPERIAQLYVSMKPEYTDDNRINGYRVNMMGEKEFFAAAGLREGDIVRKVNSLQMTSQSRAEYFIQEFLQGRLNAVVLDIEREGQQEKLIYLIR